MVLKFRHHQCHSSSSRWISTRRHQQGIPDLNWQQTIGTLPMPVDWQTGSSTKSIARLTGRLVEASDRLWGRQADWGSTRLTARSRDQEHDNTSDGGGRRDSTNVNRRGLSGGGWSGSCYRQSQPVDPPEWRAEQVAARPTYNIRRRDTVNGGF